MTGDAERSLLRSSVGFLAGGALVVATLIVATFWITDRASRLADEIVAERSVRRAAIDLLTALIDAETGFRGYLIVDDPALLGRYRENLVRIPDLLRDLEMRIAENDDLAVAINQLPEAIDAKLSFIERGISLAEAGDLAAARASVATGAGQEPMAQIRTILNDIIEGADARIVPAIEAQRAAFVNLLLAVAGIAIALIALVGGAIYTVTLRVRDLTGARAELQSLNRTLEERVEERTDDLMRANQEIQRFAYIVTHDLRAPLVNIMGFTSELDATVRPLQSYVLAGGEAVAEQDILEARRAAEEDLPEAIGFIRASVQKMDGLINAILKISRDGRRELRPERLDLDEIATNAVDAVQHQIVEAGGSVEIDMGGHSIVSDRLSLDQILGNLVDNAIKYAQRERPLALAIRARPIGRRYIEITVEDNGRGIAPEDHERVFELFRRSGMQDTKGEGIGLAHVRSLARNLGGDITVRSVPQEGSTFVLRLPIDLQSFIRASAGRRT